MDAEAKVGDIQLEITEEFLSEATGLPLNGQKWFKNLKSGVCSSPPEKLNVVTKVFQSPYTKLDGMVCWQF
jgi:hypothetical protein